jgi:hypothetical protein
MPNKVEVDNTSSAHDNMRSKLFRVNSLMGGTQAMRDAGRTLMPAYHAESNKNYRNRLSKAVLFNVFRRTIESMAGKVFSKPIVFEDVPAQVDELIPDIDLQGNNAQVFYEKVFTTGLSKGIAHVLVDSPTQFFETLQEEKDNNVRPYMIEVAPENILAAYSEIINGQEVLTHVRILETTTVRQGFDEVTVRSIRVLEPGYFQIWVEGDKEWTLVEEGEVGLDFIPLVTFYADREGLMESRPPLQDLSDLNITHWQSSSDQRNILTVSRFPLLAVSGVPAEDRAKIILSANKILGTDDKEAKFYYVEHDGKAIEAGERDLHNLEAQMAILGLEMLIKRATNSPGISKQLDAHDMNSQLQNMALKFEDFIAITLFYMGSWMGVEEAGTAGLNTDFNLTKDSTELQTLVQSVENGSLSAETYLTELKRRGVLDAELDVIKEALTARQQAEAKIKLAKPSPAPAAEPKKDEEK